MGIVDPARTYEPSYESHRLVDSLSRLVNTHRLVGNDFPLARHDLLANLRTLQSALPAAIAEVEAAMKEDDG